MVETASQRTPDIICGKPYKPMIDVIVNKYNIDPKKTLMIGDRWLSISAFTYLPLSWYINILLLIRTVLAPSHEVDIELYSVDIIYIL